MSDAAPRPVPKPVVWIASSRKDLKAFPDAVRSDIGHALYLAQLGKRGRNTKPLKGFKGAGVIEIVEDHVGDAYRAVYTVKLADRVYVLHAFQKKSRQGIATPKEAAALVKARLKIAEGVHAAWSKDVAG